MAIREKLAKRARKAGLNLPKSTISGLEAYFELLKKSVSSFPSGGTELGENLKDQGVENISALQEVVKRLSQTENFEEALRIQTAFIHSQLNVLGKQATSLGEAYTRTVKMQGKPKPEDGEKRS